MPFTSGASGPTTSMSMALLFTKSPISAKSLRLSITFSPTSLVPALPGAMYSFSIFGLCAIFHARACSRPPLPKSNSFIRVDIFKVLLRCCLLLGFQQALQRVHFESSPRNDISTSRAMRSRRGCMFTCLSTSSTNAYSSSRRASFSSTPRCPM